MILNFVESNDLQPIHENIDIKFKPLNGKEAKIEIFSNSSINVTSIPSNIEIIKSESNSDNCIIENSENYACYKFKTTRNSYGSDAHNFVIEIDNTKYNINIKNEIFMYIGGNFTQPCMHIAKWDGANLSCLRPKKENSSPVHAIFQTLNSNLYIGRAFGTNENDDTRKSIVSLYNGNEWIELKNEYQSFSGDKVSSLAVIEPEGQSPLVFAAGSFNLLNNLTNKNSYNLSLAIYKNNSWEWKFIGSPMTKSNKIDPAIHHERDRVNQIFLSEDNSKLFIGGIFNQIENYENVNLMPIQSSIGYLNNVKDFISFSTLPIPKWTSISNSIEIPSTKCFVPFSNNILISSNLPIPSDSNFIQDFNILNKNFTSESVTSMINTFKRSPLESNDIFIGGEKNFILAKFKGLNSKSITPDIKFNSGSKTNAIAITPDGKTIYIGGKYNGTEINRLKCHYLMQFDIDSKIEKNYFKDPKCLDYTKSGLEKLNRNEIVNWNEKINGEINALELQQVWSANIEAID
ncbi:hypothetical protein [Silvanigrella aquatica]|uniref:Uncharacterized protein n=1 Tax=Silvanigrella aquatica TaxID=1915309 RepID=A0A1L4CYN0_9BACT|nr:hypothetical protein [Silvanigrella aquatica]APJ03056.1 hypothetical protein AXG55_03675 [Silvanigrella aquatica]